MKKVYLVLITMALSAAAIAQTISIGTSTTTPSGSTYRSPWSPLYGYSYVQTIYLQSEINMAGNITTLKYNYSGTTLDKSDEITVWMGNVSRSAFGSTSEWEPLTGLTQVFTGAVTYGALPGIVTVTLTTPFNYTNTSNLLIAIDENKPGFETGSSFYASEVGTARTIYFNDDDPALNPNPSAPPTADGIRTKVGNIQIVFGAAQPVTLSNFSGEKSGNLNKLSWTTKSEQNCQGFELQRSADGVAFTSMSLIKSKAPGGSSNTSLSYSFTDDQCLRGNNYYRLKQLDFDGKATFSKIVMLKGSHTKFDVSVIYPNPAISDLNIILTSPVNDKATVYITDVSGKIVYKTTSNVVNGDNKIRINPSGFATGVYTVKAIYVAGNETAVSKFVKQ